MLWSANQVPKINDDSYAMWRRWITLTFYNVFKGQNRDKHILKKITTPDELSGFFNWAIEGLNRLLKNGEFSYTMSVAETRDYYTKLSDPIYAFKQEYIKICDTPKDFLFANNKAEYDIESYIIFLVEGNAS